MTLPHSDHVRIARSLGLSVRVAYRDDRITIKDWFAAGALLLFAVGLAALAGVWG